MSPEKDKRTAEFEHDEEDMGAYIQPPGTHHPSDHALDLDEINSQDSSHVGTTSSLAIEEEDEEIEIPDKPRSAADLERVFDIPVELQAVLGKSTMNVDALMKLGRGSVVEMDRKVGEAIDIYVNNRLVARGEVVVVDDQLGITMTEIIKTGRNG